MSSSVRLLVMATWAASSVSVVLCCLLIAMHGIAGWYDFQDRGIVPRDHVIVPPKGTKEMPPPIPQGFLALLYYQIFWWERAKNLPWLSGVVVSFCGIVVWAYLRNGRSPAALPIIVKGIGGGAIVHYGMLVYFASPLHPGIIYIFFSVLALIWYWWMNSMLKKGSTQSPSGNLGRTSETG